MGTVSKPGADREPGSETWSAPGDPLVDVHPTALPALDQRRFAVSGERARGGGGLVLEARDQVLGRPVALKRPVSSDRPGGAARFVREVLITARLQHPAIVSIYDAGMLASGEPCYAMPLVPGATLRDAVSVARRLDERLALLPHVQAVADAIAYAHGKGILHRDLKPGNVLVGPFGETIVIDWGLAKDMRAERGEDATADLGEDARVMSESLTSTGGVLGTPGYMPPEQARGDEVDERADVYAIGAMLYYLLTGEAPYAQNDVAAVLGGPPPPVETREPGAPRDLTAIVAKAMARDREARYPTAGELAHDLKRFATGQLVSARHYSTWELVQRFVHQHRSTVLVAVGLVAALVAGLYGIVREQNRTAVENNRLRLMQAEAVIDRDPTAAAAWLKSYRVEPGRENAAVDVAARAQEAGVARHVFTLPDDIPVRVCLDADGRRLGIVGREGSIWLHDLSAQTRRPLGKLAGAPDGCLFADHGRYLVVTGTRGAGMMAARLPDGQAVRLSVPAPADSVESMRAAGSRLFVIDREGRVHLVGLDGAPSRPLANVPPRARQALPTPDGRTLYVSDKDSQLWRVAVEGGGATLLERLEGPIYKMDLSPDGRELVLSSGQRVGIRDLETGQSWWHRSNTSWSDPIPVWWARGGAVFVSAHEHKRDPEIKWWNRQAGEPVRLGTKAYFRSVTIGGDGERAAWTDSAGAIRVADLPSHGIRTLVGHHGFIRGFDLSDDGRWLAATLGSAVRVFALSPARAREIDLQKTTPPVPAISGSNQVVAAVAGRFLVNIDGRTGRQRPLGDLGEDASYLAVAPGGRRAAASGVRGRVVVLDLQSGGLRDLAPHGGGFANLVFPDEDWLLGQDRTGQIHLWNVSAGTHQVVAKVSLMMMNELFAARRRARCVAGSGYEILVIDPHPLRVLRFDTGGAIMSRAALSADGRSVATAMSDGRVVLWDVEAQRPRPRELVRRFGLIGALFFTHDDRALLVGDEMGSLYRVDLASGAGREIGRHPSRIVDGRLSPSGRWLATSDVTGEIRMWDPTGQGLAVLRGPPESQNIRFVADDLLASVGPDGWLKLITVEPHAFVPASPPALLRWLDGVTTAQIGAGGQAVSR